MSLAKTKNGDTNIDFKHFWSVSNTNCGICKSRSYGVDKFTTLSTYQQRLPKQSSNHTVKCLSKINESTEQPILVLVNAI